MKSVELTVPESRMGGQSVAAQRLAYRLSEIATSLGVSKRHLERERSAGRMPRPDLIIGRVNLWRPATIDRWVAEGGSR